MIADFFLKKKIIYGGILYLRQAFFLLAVQIITLVRHV